MQDVIYIHASPRTHAVANDIRAFPRGSRDLLEQVLELAESMKVGVGIQCK